MGRAEQIGGTAGIDAKASEGLTYRWDLDSILSYLYRNDLALLAEWKTARHMKRDPCEKRTAKRVERQALLLVAQLPRHLSRRMDSKVRPGGTEQRRARRN